MLLMISLIEITLFLEGNSLFITTLSIRIAERIDVSPINLDIDTEPLQKPESFIYIYLFWLLL